MKKMIKTMVAVLFIGGILMSSNVFVADAKEPIDLRKIDFPDEDELFYRTQATSVKKYNHMLDKITVNKGTRGSDRRYEDAYGGSYINENGELVVLLTGKGLKSKEAIQENTGGEDVILRHCQYSYNLLLTVINEVNAELSNLAEQGIIIDEMYDDVCANRVIIRVRNLDDEKEQKIRAIINSGCMEFQNSEQGVVLQEGMKGGDTITSCDNGKDSTLGFCATLNGVEGYVTAGHSANRIGEEFTYNGELLGKVTHTAYYQDTKADAGFIEAEESGTLTPYIGGHRCTSTTTYEFPKGTTIWMYGAKSGLQKGKIESYHSSFTPYFKSDYTTVDHGKATYASMDGDSGAPVFLYEGSFGGESWCTLIGIHSADVGEGYVQFAKYANIIDELGVKATTGY